MSTPVTVLAQTVLLESGADRVVVLAFTGSHVKASYVGLTDADSVAAHALVTEIRRALLSGTLKWPEAQP